VTRCKLISPTNLMLERPMLSPVKETEFVLHGLKEFNEITLRLVTVGILLGFSGCLALLLLCQSMKH